MLIAHVQILLAQEHLQLADTSCHSHYYENGELMATGCAVFKDSTATRFGTWIYYYKNGTPRHTLQYVDGELRGIQKSYFINGKPSYISNIQESVSYIEEFEKNQTRKTYKLVKQDSSFFIHDWLTVVDRKSRVRDSIQYYYGTKLISKHYYKSGELLRLENYLNGVQSKVTVFKKNGKIETGKFYNNWIVPILLPTMILAIANFL